MVKPKIINFSFYTFLFGLSSFSINIFLFASFFFVIFHSLIFPVCEILFGLSLNYMKESDFDAIKKIFFILGILGLAEAILLLISSYFCTQHGSALTRIYKENYYDLVLQQDYKWFLGKNLNELSESIKNQVYRIEEAVIYFNLYFFYRVEEDYII